MKLLARIFAPLLVGGVCVFLVLRRMDGPEVLGALRALTPTAILTYLATLAVTHWFRASRWDYLLRPIGVRLPPGKLLAISSVGFMTILALPFRLGEFVRPYYVKRETRTSMSAVLGTVAVERIVDGLVVSLIFFGAYLGSGGTYSRVLEIGAWLSLGAFLAATLSIAIALMWPDRTIDLVLRLSLVRRFAPATAERISTKVRSLIEGFRALGQPRLLLPFLAQSLLYWGTNGVGMWLLARQMGLPLSLVGAFAAMAFTGVVISLPNPPANIGPFQFGVLVALGGYLPERLVQGTGAAYALVLWALQSVWYVGIGVLALRFAGSGSLRSVVLASQEAVGDAGPEAAR